jgi:hypothetical protein
MSNAGIPIASFGVAQLVVDPGKSSALCAVTRLIAATASVVFTVVDDHREGWFTDPDDKLWLTVYTNSWE